MSKQILHMGGKHYPGVPAGIPEVEVVQLELETPSETKSQEK